MAYSYETYTGDGTTQEFSIPFPYLLESHIHVYLDGVESTDWTFLTSSTIQMTTVPANGVTVRITRETPFDSRLVDFQNASILNESNLDLDSNQMLYAMQETIDGLGSTLEQDLSDGNWDAEGNRIKNIGTPVDAADAMPKSYGDTVIAEAEAAGAAQVDLAEAQVALANTARTKAETAETNAETAQGLAEDAQAGAVAAEAGAVAAEAGAVAAKGLAEAAAEQSGWYNHFKNKIINGNFDIWQRGTSQTDSGYGSADRFHCEHVGSSKTASQQEFTLGQTAVPNNPKYFMRHVVSSVGGAGNMCFMCQLIESVRTLSGNTVTLSFWAKADSTKNIAIEFTQYFGTGGSPSATVNGIEAQKVALTTSWQKYEITVSIPSISGKTLGTDGNDFLGLFFWFDAGSNFDSRTDSLGQQSGTFDIAQVQLEEGTVATKFEYRPVSVEAHLCARYYEVLNNVSLLGYSGGASSLVTGHTMPFTLKRVEPSVSLGSQTENTNVQSFNTTSITTNTIRVYTRGNSSGDSVVAYDGIIFNSELYLE